MPLSLTTKHLHIGSLIFPGMDQIDFTGPFEVLSRLPDSFHILAKDRAPYGIREGLILTPEEDLSQAPPLDPIRAPFRSPTLRQPAWVCK